MSIYFLATVAFLGLIALSSTAGVVFERCFGLGCLRKSYIRRSVDGEEHAQPRSEPQQKKLKEFCKQFENYWDSFEVNIRSMGQFRSACSHECVNCDNCSGGCYQMVKSGCQGVLKDPPSKLKIISPFKELCKRFISS